MIPRYEHPKVREIFLPEVQSSRYRDIEVAMLMARGTVEVDSELTAAGRKAATAPLPKPARVAEIEAEIGHDVVAWLTAWLENVDPSIRHLIHQGMTSSDLVDNWLFGCLERVSRTFSSRTAELIETLLKVPRPSNRIGRTHGQYAEPTSWGHQCAVYSDALARSHRTHHIAVTSHLQVTKSLGATGNSRLFPKNGRLNAEFTRRLRVQAGSVASTQVIPRSDILGWAGTLLPIIAVCESIANEIRLSMRSEVAEIYEATGGRRGSSAMPGKQNPIGSEQIIGFARLARGNYAALAENCALHGDRDISNSSVERVALVDLCHLAVTIVERTTRLVGHAAVNNARMAQRLEQNERAAMASAEQFLIQKYCKMDFNQAADLVRMAVRDAPSTGWEHLREFVAPADRAAFGSEYEKIWQGWVRPRF